MDIITAEERALIDQALTEMPEERRRIPTGVSAFAVDYEWTGSRLVQVGGADLSWRGADSICLGSGSRPAASPAPRKDLEEVRLEAAVAESIKGGAAMHEICDRHGVGKVRVRRIAQEQGLKVRRGRTRSELKDAKSAELDARVEALADGTMTVAELAERLGASQTSIRRRVKRLRLTVRSYGRAAR
ncbi:MAG: AsnC family transcriptional regulator [Rhodobacteraceae bacterium]|nr:AsnC family transcriptional regulator [Paracoccaceae bacterium]MBR9820735.1 AsnC family transcriptional regulator [Paracoccaceae bacterium]